ncbi:unnamed protein product, partial [Brachionus calyciflorus]
DCPAKGRKCNNCERLNHFAKVCKNGKSSVKQIETHDEYEYSSGNIWRVMMRKVSKFVNNVMMPIICLFICGSSIRFGVDTGSDVNIIDQKTYNRLRFKPKLVKTDTCLYGYGSKNRLSIVGKFKTRVKYNNEYRNVMFYLTSGDFGNLLNYETSILLGIIKPINMINAIKIDKKIEKLRSKYRSLFSGRIGKLKNHEVELHIDESVKPIQQKLRPVPFHLRPLVEKEIKNMLEQDIIEPIQGPTPWVSPIVPVPKPDRPNEIRICTDAREANKAILRSRHSCPTVEDLAVKLNGAKYISKFDLKSGYNQIMLHEKSRYITAFCTHLGIFQYKRLNFGINAASEIFQKIVEQVLSGIDGVLNFSDDIIVFGSSKTEHDQRLNLVLKRLDESGLTVNESKCEFDFFGLQFSQNGISIETKKFDALMNAKAPKTVGEKSQWKWEQKQDEALAKLKRSICLNALSYFDPKLRTELTVDASPVGLAAVLAQYDPAKPNEKRIVMFASRSLTEVEKRYSQVEREALAVVWACEKFHVYIYAKEFDIITDNKTVELIFGNPRSKPKARIERWCLRLLPYKFVVKHKAGDFNISDYMSRNPCESADRMSEKLTESYINMVCSMAIPKAVSRSQLIQVTKNDPELIEAAKMIKGQKYKLDNLFERIKGELSMSNDGLILKGSKIVVPIRLRKQVIRIAHGGHLGMVKTKQLLRSHVWFPSMDSEVERLVKSCHKCQINTDATKYEPFNSSEMPDGPWSLVSVDFYGPLNCANI